MIEDVGCDNLVGRWSLNPGSDGPQLLTDAAGSSVTVGLDEELRLILGWSDVPNTFDAWLEVAITDMVQK